VTNFFQQHVVDPVKNLLGIHSPSALMQQYGQFTALGFAQGMTGNLHLVSGAASQMALAAVPGSIGGRYGGGIGGVSYGDIYITINAAPSQSPREIAREVIREIGIVARNQSYGRPAQVIPVW